MSYKVIEDLCIGCGACDFSCPTGALTKTDSFLGLFEIDPFTCDDCAICVDKCPVLAIVVDAAWPICSGKGCPLTSSRLEEVSCAVWQERCETCGTTLWQREDGQWACPSCAWEMKVHCPRTRRLPVEQS
jgi:ferredoxin